MAFKSKKPNKKDFETIKPLKDAVAASKDTPADTKALAQAQRELETATGELNKSMDQLHQAFGNLTALAPDVAKSEKPSKVPIPYPKFSKIEKEAKSATQASEKALKKVEKANKKLVKVADKELKKLSPYIKSSGDAAGVAAHQGIVTSKTIAKARYVAWSADVKVQGKGLTRFLDVASHNTK